MKIKSLFILCGALCILLSGCGMSTYGNFIWLQRILPVGSRVELIEAVSPDAYFVELADKTRFVVCDVPGTSSIIKVQVLGQGIPKAHETIARDEFDSWLKTNQLVVDKQ